MSRMIGPDCAVMCSLINTHMHKEKKKRRQEMVGSVAADPDNLKNSKDAGGEAQGTQGLSKNLKSRESVFLLSDLIIAFRNKYRWSPRGRIHASGM